jgi:hypothetical protein
VTKVLHLLKGDATLAADVIAGQVAAGDTVTVALFAVDPPALPAAVTVRRLDADLTYGELVDLIFDADQVVPW